MRKVSLVWIIRRLRYKDMRAVFDKMMRPDIGHNLRAWDEVRVQLLLQVVELLAI